MSILFSLVFAALHAFALTSFGDPGGPGGHAVTIATPAPSPTPTGTIIMRPMCGDPGGPGGCY